MSGKINTFSKAIKHLKSSKYDMLEAAPTNNTMGFMSKDVHGFDTELQGDTRTYASPDFTQDDSADDTSGLFEADGTPKTALPGGDTSYILGPMSAMWYAWANYTQIGYIRESDRRMVNLGRISGQLGSWDQESNFYSYGQLTLEQAQWFYNVKKYNNADNDTPNYRAFYPGPPSNTPDEHGRYHCVITGEPKQTGGSGPVDGPKPPTPDGHNPGDVYPTNRGKGKDKKDPQDDLNDRYGGLSDEELRDRGYKRNENGDIVPMSDEEKAEDRAEDELEKAKEEERKALEEILRQAKQLDKVLNSDIKLASVTLTGIAIWQLSAYVTALIAAGYTSGKIQQMLNDAVGTITEKADFYDKQDIREITEIETSIFHIEADLNSDAEMADMSDAEWDQARGDQAEKENDAIKRVGEKLRKAQNGGRESVIKSAEKALDKLKEIKAKNKFRRKQVTKLRKDAKETVEGAKKALRELEKLKKSGDKFEGDIKDAINVRKLLDALKDTSIKGQVKKTYMKKHLSDATIKLIRGLNNSYEPRGNVLSESRKTQILKNLKNPVVIPEEQKKFKVKPKIRGLKTVVSKPVETPKEYKKIGGRNLWGKAEYDYNTRQSQERKNETLELLGASDHHWEYMTETSKKKNAEEMAKFYGDHPDLYTYTFGGKKQKVLRKEQLKGDYLVFLVDENGVKTNMLQSKLNEKLVEEEDKKFLDEYNKTNPKPKEPISFEKDYMFKKAYQRLKPQVNYKDKPATKGYPNDPPPEMVNDRHPDFGKRPGTSMFNKLDPQSAAAMPQQDDETIDAKVTQAKENPKKDSAMFRRKLDDKIKKSRKKNNPAATASVEEDKSDWRKDLESII